MPLRRDLKTWCSVAAGGRGDAGRLRVSVVKALFSSSVLLVGGGTGRDRSGVGTGGSGGGVWSGEGLGRRGSSTLGRAVQVEVRRAVQLEAHGQPRVLARQVPTDRDRVRVADHGLRHGVPVHLIKRLPA